MHSQRRVSPTSTVSIRTLNLLVQLKYVPMVLPLCSPHSFAQSPQRIVGCDDDGSLHMIELVCVCVYLAGSVGDKFCRWRIRSMRALDLCVDLCRC